MLLHDAMLAVLHHAGRPLTQREIADELNRNGTYVKGDGSPIAPSQVRARAKNYSHLFVIDGPLIRGVGRRPADMPVRIPQTEAPRPEVPPLEVLPIVVGDVKTALLNPEAFKPTGARYDNIPTRAGLYAIRLAPGSELPEPFASVLAKRGHDLLYIGIAGTGLTDRLRQELRAEGHGTFFRSIGAVLGYRPPTGSLIGKRNQRNYRFSPGDETAIINWLNTNTLLNWVVTNGDLEQIEGSLLRKHHPALNLRGNPGKLQALDDLRTECRRIATNS